MASSSLEALTRSAAENAIWLLAVSGLAAAALSLIWWRVPRFALRALRWLDDQVPGDFSVLHPPLSRLILASLSLAILALWAVSVAHALGAHVISPQELLANLGRIAARWLANQGLKVAAVLALAFLLQRFASRAIPKGVEQYIRARAAEEPASEVEKDIRTLSVVLGKATAVLIALGALFMVLAQLGLNLAPLLAAAGVLGIAVGFGAQALIRDILSGLLIILEKQYRVGDVVNIAGIGGLVEDISLRRTILRDLDYTQHVIPNGEVRVASNMTKIKSRVNLNIPVAYKEDLDRVIVVLNEVGQEMARDPVFGPLILEPPKVLRVDKFADSAVEIKVLGETLPIRQWDVMGEYRLRVKRAFDRLGIEIPYPHRTIYWGNAEGNILTITRSTQQGPIRAAQPAGGNGDETT